MELNEAMVILKSHRNWLADKKNLPKTNDKKVIEAIERMMNMGTIIDNLDMEDEEEVEDKILYTVAKYVTGRKNCEDLTKELLGLFCLPTEQEIKKVSHKYGEEQVGDYFNKYQSDRAFNAGVTWIIKKLLMNEKKNKS